jgi:hydrogenase-4 membrane subunit HyfE
VKANEIPSPIRPAYQKAVNGFSMLEEQRHVFGQIIGYIDTENPNAVLIDDDV